MEVMFKELPDWPLAVEIRDEFCKINLRADTPLAQRKLGALVCAWGEFTDLYNILCKCCNGRGHQWRGCPTAKRISHIAKSSLTARNRLALARQNLVIGGAAHRPVDAIIPVVGGGGVFSVSVKPSRSRALSADTSHTQ